MVSLFLVNNSPLPSIINPSSASVSINGVTSEAKRSDSGDLKTLSKVNSIAKVSLTWDYISVEQAAALCTLFGIDVVNTGESYVAKAIEELTYRITLQLPCGVRTFTAYVGDTIKGDLVDYSDDEGAATEIGGQYWRSLTLDLVGTGES